MLLSALRKSPGLDTLKIITTFITTLSFKAVHKVHKVTIGSEVKGNLLPHSFFFSFFITLALFSLFFHTLTLPTPLFFPHMHSSRILVILQLPLQRSCGVSKDLILMQQGTKIPEQAWFSQVEGITLPRAICSRWTAVTCRVTLSNANMQPDL